MKYVVEITETLQRQIEIDADDESEAYGLIRRQYRTCDIVLDDGDYVCTEYKVYEPNEDGTIDYDDALLIA